jgi:hypothetical protein
MHATPQVVRVAVNNVPGASDSVGLRTPDILFNKHNCIYLRDQPPYLRLPAFAQIHWPNFQLAPLSLHDVEHVTGVPPRQARQTFKHWSKFFGL